MKEFFVQNWKLLIICGCAFIELVLMIISICKKSKSNEPLTMVLAKLPKIVAFVEKSIGAGRGDIKKESAVQIALDLYESYTGLKITEGSRLASIISEAIEEILLTPQKKGVNND